MYTEGREYAKVGKVTVDIKGKSYRLRFTYPQGNRHEFSIARVSLEGWTTAIKAAQLISRDIDLGDFDDSYARYSPKHAKKLQIAQATAKKQYNLKELWERYKEASKDRVAKTTQKNLWKVYEKLLHKTPKGYLDLNKSHGFVNFALDNYAVSTIATLFRTCINPSVNMALRQKIVTENPFQNAPLPKIQKINVQCFEPDEVKAIIKAFASDVCTSPKSIYKDSYHACMVEFIALTGCRPEECHALTWDDIKRQGNRTFVRFNKAYTKGVLNNHTKTYTVRLFPCNAQLKALLDQIPKIDNPNNLIFPSQKKGYINQDNFRNRYWNKILNYLVLTGQVKKRLKPYCLRHSFITRLIREGVDIATVASLSGNSPQIIIKNYLASRNDFDLPEL